MTRKQDRWSIDLALGTPRQPKSAKARPPESDEPQVEAARSREDLEDHLAACAEQLDYREGEMPQLVSRLCQTREQLARLNSELRAIVDSVESAVVIIDRDGRVEYANRQFAEMFGLEPAYLATHPLHDEVLERIKANVRDPEMFAQIDAYAHQHPERPVRDELEVLRPRHRRIEHAALPIYENGVVIGQIEVFRDVTAEHDARRTEEDFLSLVSHEFRTPLTTIIGNLDYAMRLLERRDRVRASELLPRLQQTVAAAHRAEAMVGQLLDVIAIDTGQLRLHRRVLHPDKLLRSTLARLHPMTKGHELRVEVAPDLPTIFADPRRIEQVIGSLISNAVKYSEPGTPIEVSLTRRDSFVVIAVTDHGEGIARADIERLFDRFHRVRRHYATREGLGLGLYIAEQIVSAHSGRIEVESQPGVGSTFRLLLPAYQPPPTSAHPEATRPA